MSDVPKPEGQEQVVEEKRGPQGAAGLAAAYIPDADLIEPAVEAGAEAGGTLLEGAVETVGEAIGSVIGGILDL